MILKSTLKLGPFIGVPWFALVVPSPKFTFTSNGFITSSINPKVSLMFTLRGNGSYNLTSIELVVVSKSRLITKKYKAFFKLTLRSLTKVEPFRVLLML